MKKLLIAFFIFCFVIIVLFIVGRITSAFQWYTVSSSANEPALKTGSKFYASNLKKPKRFNLICYRTNTEYYGKSIFTHRLCGLPGDSIEIRQGTLYVNGENADKGKNLNLPYRIALKELELLELKEGEYAVSGADTAIAFLETNQVAIKKIRCERQIIPVSEEAEEIKKVFSKNWNQDNFGPVRVPQKHYFVLGDNRNASMDSRFLGFIPISDFVGTVLWK